MRALSGGERNRLLLARLFTRTFNLLILDEPTNDLDIETLDLLEELLLDFSGTLLLVSHDRAFLDNVVTSTLVFEGAGRVGEYAGGYSDWVRQRPAASGSNASPPRSSPPAAKVAADANAAKKRRISFKESGELAGLPERIDSLEREREALYIALTDSATLRNGAAAVAARTRLDELEVAIAELTNRWETLETLATEK